MKNEIFLKQQEQLFGIQKLLKNKQVSLDEIAELIPGIVHLNKTRTLDLTYLDKKSREILEVTEAEVAFYGKKILTDIVEPNSLQHARKLFGASDFEDPSHIVSHFQALKEISGHSDYQWYYSVKKKFNRNLIITISNPISSLVEMQSHVEKILEENLFIKKNLEKFHALTKREREIIRMILHGHTTSQISEMLFISQHTVRTHRKNIWYKLNIKNMAELFKFANNFDLLEL